MRLSTNNALIRRRVRVSVVYLVIAMGLLVGGFIASVNVHDPILQYAVSFPTLAGGLYFWWRNQTELRRFGPRGRQDAALAQALRGLDDRYQLRVFPAGALPDYLLVGPMGVLALIPRAVTGEVSCAGGRWRHETGRPPLARALLWFAPAVPLGNPGAEAARAEEATRRYLAARLSPDLAARVKVEAAVIFTDADVTLDLQGCPTAALHLRSLRGHVRRLPRALGTRELEQLTAAFAAS
jgi:hypothetical protein